jgi:probable phosphoglycerate mutase
VERARNAAADALANEAMDTRGAVVRDAADVRGDAAPSEVTGAPTTVTSRRPSGAAMRFDDEEPLTVVLLRHGETPMTASRAYSGSAVPGPGLTAAGRVQAAQAADLIFRIGRDVFDDVPHPDRLVASPMVRTQQTAAAVGRRLGLPVETDPAFAEGDFGQWEGLRADEIEAGWPGQLKRWHTDATFPMPGGESIEDVGRRVGAGLAGLLDGGVDRTVVVVSHSVAIRAAIGVTLGAPSSVWASVRVAPASVSILRMWADGAREVAVVGMPTDV